MDFHAKRASFSFQAISVNTLEEQGFSFENFFLFLDEFEDSEWTLLVRNLARAVGLRCMVAKTNTNVASLAVKSNVNALFSRGNPNHVLSIVIYRLNKINFRILNNLFPALNTKIATIIATTRQDAGYEMDQQILSQILANFKEQMLQELRPGIAILAVRTILRYDSRDHSLESFMSHLICDISLSISTRKTRLLTLFGIMGTFGLMMSNAYNDQVVPRSPFNVFHRKTYLKNHLYYLINPVNGRNQWFFLTYPYAGSDTDSDASGGSQESVPGARNLENVIDRETRPVTATLENVSPNESFFSRGDELPRQLGFFANGTLNNWDFELTHFRIGEWFTSLACIFISTSSSITSLLNQGMQQISSSPLGTGDTHNPENEEFNELEVLMCVCVLDASHHDYGDSKSNFKGQLGTNFIRNLVCNLIDRNDFRRRDSITIGYQNSREFYRFLSKIRIPFLFPANCKLPTILVPCSRASSYNQRSMHVGKFERTFTLQQIDAKFHYFNQNNRQRTTFPTCFVECKFWRSNVLVNDLIRILAKFLRPPSSQLGLIVCNKVDSQYEINTLNTFCKKKKVNLFRFKYANDPNDARKNFLLVPFDEAMEFIPEFEINCLVIELAVINN